MRYEIKQLGVGGILDQAIKLVKDNFKLLFGIVAVLLFPLTLAASLLAALNMPQAAVAGQPAVAFGPGVLIALGLIGIANGLVVGPLTNAAIIHAIASAYLDKPTSMGQSFRRAGQVYLPYLGTTILVGLFIMLGMFLLLVGAIIFGLWYCLATQIVVIEGTAGSNALKRSHQLMKGNYGTALVLFLLLIVINYAMGFGMNLIPSAIVRATIAALWQSVLVLFSSAAVIVFYFSCRCKLENFDLALLADAVGADEPETPQWGTT